LLGGRLATLLSAHHETTALVRRQEAPEPLPSVRMDLTDHKAVASTFQSLRPDVVVHCAALADSEVAEVDPDRARRENEEATRNLALACRGVSARLIAISTDLVFAGDKPFRNESSPTGPVMEYGRSKLRAEAEALEGAPGALVFRVALLCGRGHGPKRSASEAIAARLRRGEAITLYEDEWRTPIDPESVASAMEAALLRPDTHGLFHLGGEERVTRLEFGYRVAATLGLDQALIRRAPQASHSGAPRPRDVSLDSSLARSVLGWAPRPLDTALGESRCE
jgi:dTDP-4-dehydrorhamnose reductase